MVVRYKPNAATRDLMQTSTYSTYVNDFIARSEPIDVDPYIVPPSSSPSPLDCSGLLLAVFRPDKQCIDVAVHTNKAAHDHTE